MNLSAFSFIDTCNWIVIRHLVHMFHFRFSKLLTNLALCFYFPSRFCKLFFGCVLDFDKRLSFLQITLTIGHLAALLWCSFTQLCKTARVLLNWSVWSFLLPVTCRLVLLCLMTNYYKLLGLSSGSFVCVQMFISLYLRIDLCVPWPLCWLMCVKPSILMSV